MKLQRILIDIESQATRMNRASDLKRYLVTDLEIIAEKALEAQNELKNLGIADVSDCLSIKQVAVRYGQKVKCKWLTPDGNDWLDKEMTVSAHFLKEMEQGSIKDCR